jgi:NAD-dependent dihydropyrimidine dehydrogenase PreA subunit
MKISRIDINPDRCKGCGLCVDSACQKGVLAMTDPKKESNSNGVSFAKAINPQLCAACGRCIAVCSEAIIYIYREDEDEGKK